MGWVIAAIVAFINAFIEFTEGTFGAGLFFIGLGILFGYLWLTKGERAKVRAEEERKRREEEIKRREEEERRQAPARFKDSDFVNQLIRDFRSRNWADLDYKKGECNIFTDKIETPYRSYVYIDYGLAKLEVKDCKKLALYLGIASGKNYDIKEKTKFFGGVSNNYSGYVGSDGSFSASRDVVGGCNIIGYQLYDKDTVPPPAPQGKKW